LGHRARSGRVALVCGAAAVSCTAARVRPELGDGVSPLDFDPATNIRSGSN
jgi:hypothetical protein